MTPILSIYDLIFPIFWVPVLLWWLVLWHASNSKGRTWERFFVSGFIVRVICVAAFGLIYQFIYKSGDTFLYFKEAMNIRRSFADGNWDAGLQLLFGQFENYTPETMQYVSEEYMYSMTNNHFIVSLAGMVNMICLDSYISIAVFMMAFGYIGTWRLYLRLCERLPNHSFFLAVIFIFLPTPFFWGSGLMKEPICVGAIGFFLSGLLDLENKENRKMSTILTIASGACILFFIKSYILYSFTAAIGVAGLFWKIRRVGNKSGRWLGLRLLLYVCFFSSIIGAFVLAINSLGGEAAQKFIMEIGTTQSVQILQSAGGSGYELAAFEPTPLGLASFLASAVATTLFRPFPWEMSKAIMIINVLEAMVTLLATVWAVKRAGWRGVIDLVTGHYIFIFCLFVTLFFGAIVGAISFNYGTLVRYKAPMLPFYYLALLFLWNYKAVIGKCQISSFPNAKEVIV